MKASRAPCALCLYSEEVREQVGRVEVRGRRLFGFRKGLFFFGLLIVIGDRGQIRKLKLVVEGKVRGRVGRVGRARVAQVVRDALPLQAHPPAGADFLAERSDRPLAAVLSHGARRKFVAAPCLKNGSLPNGAALCVSPLGKDKGVGGTICNPS